MGALIDGSQTDLHFLFRPTARRSSGSRASATVASTDYSEYHFFFRSTLACSDTVESRAISLLNTLYTRIGIAQISILGWWKIMFVERHQSIGEELEILLAL